jgi:hypothetical protein
MADVDIDIDVDEDGMMIIVRQGWMSRLRRTSTVAVCYRYLDTEVQPNTCLAYLSSTTLFSRHVLSILPFYYFNISIHVYFKYIAHHLGIHIFIFGEPHD